MSSSFNRHNQRDGAMHDTNNSKPNTDSKSTTNTTSTSSSSSNNNNTNNTNNNDNNNNNNTNNGNGGRSALSVRVRTFKEKIDAMLLIDIEISPCRRYAAMRNSKRELLLFSLLPILNQPAASSSTFASAFTANSASSAQAASSSTNSSNSNSNSNSGGTAATNHNATSGTATAGSGAASAASGTFAASTLEGVGEFLSWFNIKNVVHYFWLVAAAPSRTTSLYYQQKKQRHDGTSDASASKQIVLVVLKSNQDTEFYYFPVAPNRPSATSATATHCSASTVGSSASPSNASSSAPSAPSTTSIPGHTSNKLYSTLNHDSTIERAERVTIVTPNESTLLFRSKTPDRSVHVQAQFNSDAQAVPSTANNDDVLVQPDSRQRMAGLRCFTLPLSLLFTCVDTHLPRMSLID
jgi:hypothetical protein